MVAAKPSTEGAPPSQPRPSAWSREAKRHLRAEGPVYLSGEAKWRDAVKSLIFIGPTTEAIWREKEILEGNGLLRRNSLLLLYQVGAPAFMRGEERFSAPGKT